MNAKPIINRDGQAINPKFCADPKPASDALWRHRRAGEVYIVRLGDTGHVMDACGPIFQPLATVILDSGDWTGDPELAADIEAHQDDYADWEPQA